MPTPDDEDAARASRRHVPELTAGRTRVRAHRDEDLGDFFELYSDPQVMRYWSFPAWIDIAQARERFAGVMTSNDPDHLLCWAIAERDGDRLIGGVTLHAINRTQGRAEIGYALRPSHWGRGHAQAALNLAIGHAFGVLGLRRIEADTDPRNAASCRLAERMGFIREGLLRERWHVAGETCDTALYGLLVRDWRAAGN